MLPACLAPGAAAAPVPRAHAAYEVEGLRWPGARPRITVLNRTAYRQEVRDALTAWNESGARLRLVATRDPATADVVVDYLDARGGEADALGLAQEGYLPRGALVRGSDGVIRRQGAARVWLKRLPDPRRQRYKMTVAATHELGHVLGLAHEDRTCATMNAALWEHCRPVAPLSRATGGGAPCSFLQPDDLRGIVARYGGRVRRPRSNCAALPSRIHVGYVPDSLAVRLDWRSAAPAPAAVASQVAWGACPVVPGRFGSLLRPRRAGASTHLDAPVAGPLSHAAPYHPQRVCIALQPVRRIGSFTLLSRTRYVGVTYDPPLLPAPAAIDAAVTTEFAGDIKVDVTWHAPKLDGVEVYAVGANPGTCPAPTVQPSAFARSKLVAPSARTAQLSALHDRFYTGAGTYCFGVWTTDLLGRNSAQAALVSAELP
ncbi:MAG TPA: matrixin family metalloprotease [Conexibacter sp.]|nr:matrixin family metalloprotease [Conexibacter sp.]